MKRYVEMTDVLKTTLVEAAGELENIIQQGADLYLRGLFNPNVPVVKVALGFGQQEQPESPLITCFVNYSNQSQSGTDSLDFPVLVDRSLLHTVKSYLLANFQVQQVCSTDPVEHNTECCQSLTDSLENSPHVTRAMISDEPAPFIALSWLCNPQVECFISHRRHWLCSSLSAPEADMASTGKMQLLVKEIVLLDLLLSVCPKLKSLWEFRLWLVKQIFSHHLLTNVKKGNSLDLLLARWQQQDDECFFTAAHNHSMNYNAWHYRRCAYKILYASLSAFPQALELIQEITRNDAERVIHFTREHNGDSSATSYLLFVLHEEDVRDRKQVFQDLHDTTHHDLETSQGLTPSAERNITLNQNYPCAPHLWKILMKCTQTEIRRHYEKGHESMWYLRLGLVRWAYTQTSHIDLFSSWSVENELEWVSAYVAAVSSVPSDQLLSPVSNFPYAWIESFGSLAWTSYNATRYGLGLLSILGYPNSRTKND